MNNLELEKQSEKSCKRQEDFIAIISPTSQDSTGFDPERE